jgi:hypothetical protein
VTILEFIRYLGRLYGTRFPAKPSVLEESLPRQFHWFGIDGSIEYKMKALKFFNDVSPSVQYAIIHVLEQFSKKVPDEESFDTVHGLVNASFCSTRSSRSRSKDERDRRDKIEFFWKRADETRIVIFYIREVPKSASK